MKRLCKTCLKYTLLVFIILSSALALYVYYRGSDFDPVKEIHGQELRLRKRMVSYPAPRLISPLHLKTYSRPEIS